MDERVKDLLDRVRQTAETMGEVAGSTARCAGKYAGTLMDITKLNLQIFDLNAEASDLLKAIGQTVYDAHLGVETDEEALSSMLSQLDVNKAQVLELKERVSALKNTQTCPSCGAPCSREDRFCRSCGAAL